jgi:hypothetical protein
MLSAVTSIVDPNFVALQKDEEKGGGKAGKERGGVEEVIGCGKQ